MVDRDQRPKIRLSIKPAVSAPVDTTPVDGGWEEATEDVQPELDTLQVTDIGTGPPRRTVVPGEVPPRGTLESDTELRRGIQAPSPTKRRRDEPARSILQSSVGDAVIVDEASIDIEAPVRAPPPMPPRGRDDTPPSSVPPPSEPVEPAAPVSEPVPPSSGQPSSGQPVSGPVLAAPTTAQLRPVRPKRTSVQLSQALTVSVPVFGTPVPLWTLLGAAIVTTAFVCGLAALVLFGAAAVNDPSPVASGSPATSASSAPSTVGDRARAGEAGPIQTLKEKSDRTSDEVVAVSLGDVAAKRNELSELARRIREDSKLGSNAETLKLLRKRAYDSDVYREAQELIAHLDGELSADLLYAVWTGTAARTDPTELAEGLVNSQDVRAKASPALLVALDLRRAQSCEQRKELLARAIQYGDQRSMVQLSWLRSKVGCGPKKIDDCHACLRGATALEEAIQSVSRRAPPNL